MWGWGSPGAGAPLGLGVPRNWRSSGAPMGLGLTWDWGSPGAGAGAGAPVGLMLPWDRSNHEAGTPRSWVRGSCGVRNPLDLKLPIGFFILCCTNTYHGHSLNFILAFFILVRLVCLVIDHCLAVFHGVGITNFRGLNVRLNYEATFLNKIKLCLGPLQRFGACRN